MKIKTSELSGKALDWAVCTSLGWELREVEEPAYWRNDPLVVKLRWFESKYSSKGLFDDVNPHKDWTFTGSLFQEYCTALNQHDSSDWWAHCGNHIGEGSTPLEAICRAVVASKFGDEVEVPDELLVILILLKMVSR